MTGVQIRNALRGFLGGGLAVSDGSIIDRAPAVFDATGDNIQVTATTAAEVSVMLRFRPWWVHTDGAEHVLFDATFNGTNLFHWNKYVDNSSYVGMMMGGGNQRIVVTSGNYAFNYGQIHTAVYTASDTTNAQEVFVDAVSKGTSSTAFTLTAPTIIKLGNANVGGVNANMHLYHAAMLDRIVTAEEIRDYQAGIDPVSTNGNFSLRFHRKFEDVWNARAISTNVHIIP